MGQKSTKRLGSLQEDCYGKTRVNISNLTFTWEIENFSHCPQQTGEELRSSTFSGRDSKDKWQLGIYVRGRNQEDEKGYVALFLYLAESDRKSVGVKYLFSLKTHTEEHSYTGGKLQNALSSGGNGWGWGKFVTRAFLLDPQNGLLPDDKLIIVCSMAVAEDIVNVDSELTVPSSRKAIAAKYINHEFGDVVTLSVGGKQFNVYKAVLSAHSPIFSAMFDHDTKESQTGQIDIEDTEPEVMKEMLQFLYTGSAPNLKAMADRLLVLADKYQVQPLKLICEEAMCEKIEVENACAILVQADRLSANQLKSYAVKFMVAKATEVFNSEGFKSLIEQYPELHLETLKTMAANRFKTK